MKLAGEPHEPRDRRDGEHRGIAWCCRS
jgi:hypothetical protein